MPLNIIFRQTHHISKCLFYCALSNIVCALSVFFAILELGKYFVTVLVMERITTLLITLFISLFSSPSWSDQSLKRYSDEVFKSKGSMSCKVKSNSITILEDGIPKSYSSYTGRFKVGDLMTLTYGDIYYQDF